MSDKKPSELLTEAKAVIEDVTHWTTQVYARDQYGEPEGPSSDSACQFCSLGALRKIWFTSDKRDYFIKGTPYDTACDFLIKAIKSLHPTYHGVIADFNDARTHGEVMEAWDLAITFAKASGQ